MRRKKKKKSNRRKLRRRRGRGLSNAHDYVELLMTVGCLLKVSANLQQVKPAKQDINKKCKIKRMRLED